MKKKQKGCGKLIPVDSSDKNSEGWICGQYYDSFKKVILCPNCKPKNHSQEKSIVGSKQEGDSAVSTLLDTNPADTLSDKIKRVHEAIKDI